MEELSTVQRIAVWVLPVIFAITVHEVAHGWVANRLGDSTAKMMGRLTLNPLKHIDLIGTLLVPGVLVLLGGFIFGWAKPVPVTWENLKKPKRDIALVALAGPGANLLMMVFWAVILKIGLILSVTGSSFAIPMVLMGDAGIIINIILMILNLLPIPPLDGGRVLVSVLPGPLAWKVSKIEPYGLFIIIGLMFLGVLSWIMSGPIMGLRNAVLVFIS